MEDPTAAHNFSQVKFNEEEWGQIVEWVQDNYMGGAASDLTHQENRFMHHFIFPNGEIMENLKLTFTVLRDIITFTLGQEMLRPGDYHKYDNSPVAERLRLLESALETNIPEFAYNQRQCADNHAEHLRSEAQQALVDMEIGVGDIPTRFLIDVGRFLGYRIAPNSGSWDHAGKSYNFRMFCTTLYNDIHDIHPGVETTELGEDPFVNDDDDDDEEEEEKEEVGGGVPQSHHAPLTTDGAVTEWIANSKPATCLRVCLLSIIYDKIQAGHEYSEDDNLDLYLKSAITMFNDNASSWRFPQFSLTLFNKIRGTAKGTWLARLVSRGKQPGGKDKPSGSLLEAIPNKKDRELWEYFFDYHISREKIKAPNCAHAVTKRKDGPVSHQTTNRRAKQQLASAPGEASSSSTTPQAATASSAPSTSPAISSVLDNYKAENEAIEFRIEEIGHEEAARSEELNHNILTMSDGIQSINRTLGTLQHDMKEFVTVAKALLAREYVDKK
jgi:hypothetical protein